MQRSNTDWKVFEFLSWAGKTNHQVWFSKIKAILHMDNTVLRNSLNRLIEKNEIIAYPCWYAYTKQYYDKYGFLDERKYVIKKKCYKIYSEKENKKIEKKKKRTKKIAVNELQHLKLKQLRKESNRLRYHIKKALQNKEKPDKKILKDFEKIKTQLTEIRHNRLDEKHEMERLKKIRRKNYERKKYPESFRLEIFRLMIDIDYHGYDEKKILANDEIKKRTYDSQIKRSSRLQWLRKKLIHYRENNKELPFEKRLDNYHIPYSLTWTKREFMYPQPEQHRKKLSQWFRKS